MGIITIKLPDVGEGIAEAELIELNVKPGDRIEEDQVLASVMTDKATVEIPSPATGTVVWVGGEIGKMLAVGGALVRIDVAGVEGDATPEASPSTDDKPKAESVTRGDLYSLTIPIPNAPTAASPAPADVISYQPSPKPSVIQSGPPRAFGERPLAAPSIRLLAKTNGVDLRYVRGSGPAGRISRHDFMAYMSGSMTAAGSPEPMDNSIRETKVIGLRRKIAERMANAKRRIPHITIVEEIDVSALESLREQLNTDRRGDRPKLTVLPFLMAAMVRAIREQPGMNANFDDDNETLREFSGVHIGIATQTKSGLMVPVVRHSERRSLWDAAAEIARVAEAARTGTATRDELSGSTITISSLGPLGAIATTPIINYPEVAIIGVNRMEIRPKWDGSEFVPRKMMNLSSSFDHRVIDGWDAAVFVKRLKTLLETPALIFVET